MSQIYWPRGSVQGFASICNELFTPATFCAALTNLPLMCNRYRIKLKRFTQAMAVLLGVLTRKLTVSTQDSGELRSGLWIKLRDYG